jgi:hypothetical protein
MPIANAVSAVMAIAKINKGGREGNYHARSVLIVWLNPDIAG